MIGVDKTIRKTQKTTLESFNLIKINKMHPLYRESPLLLLSYTEGSHEFKLSQEGKDFLSSLESPLGIVGVAGLYRTGKSYLLNKVLLNRTKGFGVGPTVNPCTKGI